MARRPRAAQKNPANLVALQHSGHSDILWTQPGDDEAQEAAVLIAVACSEREGPEGPIKGRARVWWLEMLLPEDWRGDIIG